MPGEAGMLVGGRYLLVEVVGEGGMGRVWRGHDQLLDHEVAIKEILLPPQSPQSPQAHADQVARTMREARAAARLRDHPGVVTVYDVVEQDGVPWIVMQFVSGPSLGTEIDRLGRLPWQRAAKIGRDVAGALAAAHEVGIVHRDLKPDNIVLTGQQAVVTDFGIARIIGATRLTGTGMQLGTANYMAPERLKGVDAGPPADLWALGATLYAATEGRPPFDAPTPEAIITAALTQDPAAPQHADTLRELIGSLLAKDPAKRPSAQAVASALRDIADEPTEVVITDGHRKRLGQRPDDDAGRPASGPRRRLPAIAAIAAACTVLAAAIAVPLLLASPGPARTLLPSPSTSPAKTPTTSSTRPAQRPKPTVTATLAFPGIPGVQVNSVAFGRGSILAIGDWNGYTYLEDTTTRKQIALLHASTSHIVDSVAFSLNGETLAVGDFNGTTYLWDTTATSKSPTPLHGPNSHVNSVAFGPNGILAVGYANGTTYLWDTTATSKSPTPLHGPANIPVESVAFSPDGKTLAVGYANGTTYLWSTRAKTYIPLTVKDLNGHSVDSVAFSPNGETLAVGGATGTTYLWNTTDISKPLARLAPKGIRGHEVKSVAFAPDGILAVGEDTGVTYLWDTATSVQLQAFGGPKDITVDSVAFSLDGKTLATGDFSGYAYLWPHTE